MHCAQYGCPCMPVPIPAPVPLPPLACDATQGFVMPNNVRATTHAPEAIVGAKFAVHAVPVQSSRAFLQVGRVG